MRASMWWQLLLPALALVSSWSARCFEAAVTTDELEPLPPPLQWDFYNKTCPDVEKYVKEQIELYAKQDKTLAPKFIRILYADCFIKGCDASFLLDGPDSEKTAAANSALLGAPLDVIDKIKEVLEQNCPGVVSCADIINLAARDAVVWTGGTSYPVPTGRRDGNSSTAASVDLPLSAVPWSSVVPYFQARGLDVLDLTTLLGGHSLGRTGCVFISDRLYDFNKTGQPDPSMDPSLLVQLREQCPQNSTNHVYLNPDTGENYTLGDTFYHRVLTHRAVLGIDQQIAAHNDSYQIAEKFDASFDDFKKNFGRSMTRMGFAHLLPGDQGEIRKNCRVVNGK
ncbi:hypothetical protein BT93_A0098 [Corymbia citriodora subsp. variegata]|nr:hypothetical protein BT93_A0098 [Corymbia citriodora subsp. variegata]